MTLKASRVSEGVTLTVPEITNRVPKKRRTEEAAERQAAVVNLGAGDDFGTVRFGWHPARYRVSPDDNC